MGDYLSWDLISSVEYEAGDKLELNLQIHAPNIGRRKEAFYVVGALYTAAMSYIADTLFYIFVPPGVTYGSNDVSLTTVWELEPDESMSLPCQLTLDRSGVVLGMFLFRVEEHIPSIGVDEQIDAISVILSEGGSTMGDYLSTTITSPQVKAVGETVAGALEVTPPSAGNFYLLVEQYSSVLAFIPGSRAYLHQAVAGGDFVNSTTLYTTLVRVAADVAEDITALITLLSTECYLYIFLKQRASSVIAGSFTVGTTYEIMSIGTTDFTLIGATANTVGATFVATGIGVGTGTAAVLPAPDTDDTVDSVVITIESTTDVAIGGIDIGEIMNLMITMMIVVMMVKMMGGAMQTVSKPTYLG